MTADMQNGILRQVLFMNMLESLKNYKNNGILKKVEKEKADRDILEGPAKVKHYNINSAEQFLKFSSDTFNCAHWSLEHDEEGFTATTDGCVICSLAKKLGAPSPCKMTCISPVRGVIKGIDSNHDLKVLETLWEGNKCIFRVNR